MTINSRLAGTVAVGIVLLAGAAIWFGSNTGRGCSSHDNVIARVAVVSSDLQQAAASEKMTVERLAEGIKRLNTAATSYESMQDHQAYCDALDTLSRDFQLRE